MKAALKIESPDGEGELIDLEFSEEQIQILKTFCDDAWRLRTSAIYGEKAANKFTVNYNHKTGWSFTGDPIDQEAWDAGMHRLRPLLLSKEPASFLNVAALVDRKIKSVSVREQLKRIRKKFRGDLLPLQLSWNENGIRRSMDDMFYLWINAFEHHRDRDKQEYFLETGKLITPDEMKHYINMHAVEKLRAIMELFVLIVQIFGDDVVPNDLKGKDITYNGQKIL